MVSFGKNKDDKAVKKHRYRYDLPSEKEAEIADVLLTEQDEAPLAAALVEPVHSKDDEPIYELVLEEKTAAGNEAPSSATTSLNEQVEKLCREYEAVNQQLEKSLLASNELSKQLENSKKVVAASYIALSVAGLALLAGIGAVVMGINMQREAVDLRNSVAALNSQALVEKKQTALTNEKINAQIVELNDKVDKIFAVDNLDNVLQVTRELRKQVHALADKNLALMSNTQSRPVTEAAKPDKMVQPALKADAGPALSRDKKSAVNQPVDEPVAAKTETIKKTPEDKPQPDKNADSNAHWTVIVGTFKDKNLAKETVGKFKKAGLGVEIEQIKQKKQVWHRVVSKKFASKQDAQNYAEQMEKTLGIHAVVSKN